MRGSRGPSGGLRVGALGALVLASLPPPAAGYVRARAESGAPVRWRLPAVTLVLSDAARSRDLSQDRVRRALEAAAAVWSYPAVTCTAARVLVAASTASTTRVRQDGVSVLFFREDVWCKNGDAREGCYEHDAQAITSVFLRRNPGRSDDGEIVEADIEVNGVDFRWTLDGGTAQHTSYRDLRATLIHELGHVLGLEHPCSEAALPVGASPALGLLPCERAPTEIRATTMFPAELLAPRDVRMVLSADERKGLCEVYPRSTRHGCSIAGSGGPPTAGYQPLALALLWLFRRRRGTPVPTV
jgi:MYXO-CTERM domain-containing protein